MHTSSRPKIQPIVGAAVALLVIAGAVVAALTKPAIHMAYGVAAIDARAAILIT
jgi:hypothetical protein